MGALIPDVEFDPDTGYKRTPHEEDNSVSKGLIGLIDIDLVRPNPYQPRAEFDDAALEDLSQSIKKHGVIQPITVHRSINGYELISGERRLRASQLAGLAQIPAYVLEVDSDLQLLELALIENLQRENLNPIEIANGYKRLMEEFRYTQEQLAERVSKDRSTIANFLRLLKLPEKIQELVRSKEISMGHARAIAGLSDAAFMIYVAEQITTKNLSVRATETLVREIESGKLKPGANQQNIKSKQTTENESLKAIMADISNKLRHKFGTNVKINTKNNDSGSIEFEYYSGEELERLIEIFISQND